MAEQSRGIKKKTEAQIVRFYKNNNRFLLEGSFQHRLKHASQLHTHPATLTLTHIQRDAWNAAVKWKLVGIILEPVMGLKTKIEKTEFIQLTMHCIVSVLNTHTHAHWSIFQQRHFPTIQFVQPVNFWVRHLLLEEEEGEGKELHFFTYFGGPDPRAVQLCMSWGNR